MGGRNEWKADNPQLGRNFGFRPHTPLHGGAKAKLYANMMGYEGQWVGDWVNCKETQGNAQWVAVVMLPDSAFGTRKPVHSGAHVPH